jgi:hypothetical protein
MADFDVKKPKTPADCRNFMKNARKKGLEDLYALAFRRLCDHEARQDPDPIVVEFWRAITALEEVRRAKHGKTVQANRTRRKVQKDGVMATIEALVLAKKPSDGFNWLVDANLAELTAEHIVTRYPEHFSAQALAAAKARLT